MWSLIEELLFKKKEELYGSIAFIPLGGGPKAGMGGPWLTWALPEVSAMQLPQVGETFWSPIFPWATKYKTI